GGVRDGGHVDAEGGQIDGVGLALVVIRPRLARRAELERAARHQYIAGRVHRYRRWLIAQRVLEPGRGLQRLAHRLGVLELVLHDQTDRVVVAREARV